MLLVCYSNFPLSKLIISHNHSTESCSSVRASYVNDPVLPVSPCFLLFIHKHVWKSHITPPPIFWLVFIYSARFCQAHMLVLWMINTFVIWRACFSILGQSIQMENRFSSLMNLWGLLTGPGGDQTSRVKEFQNKTQIGWTPPPQFLLHHLLHFPLLSLSLSLLDVYVWKSFVFDNM